MVAAMRAVQIWHTVLRNWSMLERSAGGTGAAMSGLRFRAYPFALVALLGLSPLRLTRSLHKSIAMARSGHVRAGPALSQQLHRAMAHARFASPHWGHDTKVLPVSGR